MTYDEAYRLNRTRIKGPGLIGLIKMGMRRKAQEKEERRSEMHVLGEKLANEMRQFFKDGGHIFPDIATCLPNEGTPIPVAQEKVYNPQVVGLSLFVPGEFYEGVSLVKGMVGRKHPKFKKYPETAIPTTHRKTQAKKLYRTLRKFLKGGGHIEWRFFRGSGRDYQPILHRLYIAVNGKMVRCGRVCLGSGQPEAGFLGYRDNALLQQYGIRSEIGLPLVPPLVCKVLISNWLRRPDKDYVPPIDHG